MKRFFLVALLLVLSMSCSKVEYRKLDILEQSKAKSTSRLTILPAKSSSEIKITIFVPLSGKYKHLGQSVIDAIQLSLQALKADNIVFKTIDTGSNIFKLKEAISDVDLIDTDIILGPIFKEQAKHIHKYAMQQNLVMITYSNSLDLMNKPGLYIFNIIPEHQIEEVVKYAAHKQYSHIYSIVPQDEYGNSVRKTLLTNIARDHYELKKILLYSTPDIYTGQRFGLNESIFNIKNLMRSDIYDTLHRSSYPALLIPEWNGRLIKILNQLQFLYSTNDPKYKILGIGDWSQYSLAQNLTTQEAWIADIPHKSLYEFEEKFMNYYNYKPARIAAIAADSIAIVNSILGKSDDGIIIKFQELEKSDGYQGVSGTFRLKSDGTNNRLYSIYEYRNGEVKEISPANKKF